MAVGRNPGGVYHRLEQGDKVMIMSTLAGLLVWFLLKGRKYV